MYELGYAKLHRLSSIMGIREQKMLEAVAIKYRDKAINVVFDVDDVLNNLNDYVFGTLGLPEPDTFKVNESSLYTAEQKKAIMTMYGTADTFRHLQYDSLCKNLPDLETIDDVHVWINSVCFTHEIADVKLEQLRQYTPGLDEDHIIFQITSDGSSKRELSCGTIMVEDNILNLFTHEETPIKILIDKSYNKAEVYGTHDETHGIIRVKSLAGALCVIDCFISLSR